MRPRKRLIIVLVIIVALLAAACSTEPDELVITTSPSETEPTEAPEPEPTEDPTEEPTEEPTPEPEPTEEPEADDGLVVMVAGRGCDVEDVVRRALLNMDWEESQFVIGQDQIDWTTAAAQDRGEGAFNNAASTTAEELVRQLAADDEAMQAALAALREESGATDDQLLEPNNWVPAQFDVASYWPGNTMYRSGAVVAAGERQSEPGDVAWLFVHPTECRQVAVGDDDTEGSPPEDVVTSHRAGCDNPQRELPRPRPKQPEVKKPQPPRAAPPPAAPPPAAPPSPPPSEEQHEETPFDCAQDGRGSHPDCPPLLVQPDSSQHNPGQPTGPTAGAPATELPPTERPPGHSDGGSGDGGAGPAQGPRDDTHSGDHTGGGDGSGDSDGESTEPPPCPFGPGNC